MVLPENVSSDLFVNVSHVMRNVIMVYLNPTSTKNIVQRQVELKNGLT